MSCKKLEESLDSETLRKPLFADRDVMGTAQPTLGTQNEFVFRKRLPQN